MEFAALEKPQDLWDAEKDAIDGAIRMRTDAESQTKLIDDIVGMLDRTLQRDDSQEVQKPPVIYCRVIEVEICFHSQL